MKTLKDKSRVTRLRFIR